MHSASTRTASKSQNGFRISTESFEEEVEKEEEDKESYDVCGSEDDNKEVVFKDKNSCSATSSLFISLCFALLFNRFRDPIDSISDCSILESNTREPLFLGPKVVPSPRKSNWRTPLRKDLCVRVSSSPSENFKDTEDFLSSDLQTCIRFDEMSTPTNNDWDVDELEEEEGERDRISQII